MIQFSPLRANSASPRGISNAPVSSVRAEARPASRSQPGAPRASALANAFQGLNEKTAALQQVNAFAGEAREVLADLRAQLGDQLSDRLSDPGALEASLAGFSDVWNARSVATSSSLDSRLQITEPGQAKQAFTINGLSGAEIAAGEAENVRFSLAGRQSDPVTIGAGQSVAERAVNLDRALSPLGVRVSAQGDEVSFSVADGEWSALRDGLLIRGEGRRFPTGQYSLLRVSAAADSVQPETWSVGDQKAVRRTLQAAFVLDRRLERVGEVATAQLGALDDQIDAASAEDGTQAAQFAQGFAAIADSASSFRNLARLLPAAANLDRSRVRTLLRL